MRNYCAGVAVITADDEQLKVFIEIQHKSIIGVSEEAEDIVRRLHPTSKSVVVRKIFLEL